MSGFFGHGGGGGGVPPPAAPQEQHPYQQQPPQQPYQQYGGQQGYPQQGGYPPTSGYPPATSPGPNIPYNSGQGYQQPPPGQPPYNYNYNYNQGPTPSQQGWQAGPPPQQYYDPNAGPMPPAAPYQSSGWGQPNPSPAAPIQQIHLQNPAPSGGTSAKGNDGGSRSLGDKLSRLGLGHKKKKGGDSSSSSSSSSDDDKKSKSKKKNNFYNPPAGNYHPYPFSPLCPRNDPEMIVLEIVDAGAGHDRLVGPNQDYDHPAYKLEYGDNNDFKLYRCEFPALDVDKPVWAGSLMSKKESLDTKIKFKFPWGKWGLEDLTTSEWSSDVGLLEGKHWMRWYFIEDTQTYNTNSFVVRNTDIDEERKPTAAQVIMKNYDSGRIELPARLFRTMEQLDESVVIALSIICYWRDYVKENPDGKVSNLVREEIEKP